MATRKPAGGASKPQRNTTAGQPDPSQNLSPEPPASSGQVEQKVRGYVESLGDLAPEQAVLASIALNLACRLDWPDDGKIVAGVSKELRSTLDSLAASMGSDEEESPLGSVIGL